MSASVTTPKKTVLDAGVAALTELNAGLAARRIPAGGYVHGGPVFQPFTARHNPTPGEVIRTWTNLAARLQAEFGSGADVNDVIEYLIENDLLSEKAYAEFGVKE